MQHASLSCYSGRTCTERFSDIQQRSQYWCVTIHKKSGLVQMACAADTALTISVSVNLLWACLCRAAPQLRVRVYERARRLLPVGYMVGLTDNGQSCIKVSVWLLQLLQQKSWEHPARDVRADSH
jgi:hypothetical protein